MGEYRFLTTWCLDAPIERCWTALEAIERWPEWWRGVERVDKLEHGDEQGVGALYLHQWRSRVPYPVRFATRVTRIERPFVIEATAYGELAGEGRWRLYEGPGTAMTYEWNVRTTVPWMNWVGPVARPVFEWNHHWVMRQGAESLARALGVPLLARS